MPAPYPVPTRGKPVNSQPSGFPLYFDKRKPRVVAADAWALLRHLAVTHLDASRERIALAYIDQGLDFYRAAQNPRLGSQPLLYYYSFLNLVKAGLLIRRVKLTAAARHGIQDTRANQRERLRLEGQTVRMEAAAGDHSAIFPEFVRMLGGDASGQRDMKIVDLLAQVPAIHRTFCRVTGARVEFCPISRVEVLHAGGQVWTRVALRRDDDDVEKTLPTLRRRQQFRSRFHQVLAANPNEVWFESRPVAGRKRGVDRAIVKLAADLRRVGVSGILTRVGHRFYFTTRTPTRRVPQLAASYAVVFYLGSVTRYKPDVFDKIVSGGHAWVVQEFLSTQPIQFIYCLASELAGVDVVRPYAALD